MPDKHPTEIIQNLDFDIHNLEKTIMSIKEDIEQLNFRIKYQNERLENLKHQKKSLLNYLNEND